MYHPSSCKIWIFGFILAGLTLATPAQGQGRPQLVKDINPGAGDGIAWQESSIAPPTLRMVSNGIFVFFKANDGVHGEQLWRSDGTDRGTIMLTEPPSDGQSELYEPVVDGLGRVFFRHGDPTHGNELWVSDGTTSGTHMCFDLCPGAQSGVQSHLATLGDRVVFTGSTPAASGIWISDGATSGTHLLKDHLAGADALTTVNLICVHEGMIYYTGYRGTNMELWQSDGTTSSTKLFSVLPRYYAPPFPQMTSLQSGLLFVLGNGYGTTGVPCLASGSGNPAAIIDQDFIKYPDSTVLLPVSHQGKVYFAATFFVGAPYNDMFGTSIYRVADDGSITTRTAIGAHGSISEPNTPLAMIDAGEKMLLWTMDRHGASSTAGALFSCDGTDEGTNLLKNLFFSGQNYLVGSQVQLSDNIGLSPDPMVVAVPGQKRWIFGARDDETNTGFELWQTDGTAAGTRLLADLNPGAPSSYPRNMTVCNDKLFLTATDSVHGRELWVVPIPAQTNAARGWERFH